MGPCISSQVFRPPREASCNTESSNGRTFTQLDTRHGSEITVCHLDQHYPRTILYAHGNAEEIGSVVEYARTNLCEALRANFVAFSYTGYPLSTGTASESAVYNDIEAVYQYMRTELRLQNHQIILYGRSLGAAPVIHLAYKHELTATGDAVPFNAIILVSAFTSVYRVKFNFRRTYIGDMFPNIDRVEHIRSPTLFIVGMEDTVVPPVHSRQLFVQCGSQRKRIMELEDCGHNDIYQFINTNDGPDFFNDVRGFIDGRSRVDGGAGLYRVTQRI